ncbi:P-loop containing nucleoside triphosphate hydrolase protein [Hypoxylon sp. NC0597]|nr:P-loop containing nucleoside triphosphate hydrolase protein [Hypoxylon sp. NC0597]
MLPIICITGIPAGGKETLGAHLAQHFDLYHLFIADLLKSMARLTLTVGKYIKGESLPSELMGGLLGWKDTPVNVMVSSFHAEQRSAPLGFCLVALRRKIQEIANKNEHKGILIDDFPRQVDHIRVATQFFGAPFPDLTIIIDCPAHIARSRYLTRTGFGNKAGHFEARLDNYWKHMPALLKGLEGSEVVRSLNDDSASIKDSYIRLLGNLFLNKTWTDVVNRQVKPAPPSPPSMSPSELIK